MGYEIYMLVALADLRVLADRQLCELQKINAQAEKINERIQTWLNGNRNVLHSGIVQTGTVGRRTANHGKRATTGRQEVDLRHVGKTNQSSLHSYQPF